MLRQVSREIKSRGNVSSFSTSFQLDEEKCIIMQQDGCGYEEEAEMRRGQVSLQTPAWAARTFVRAFLVSIVR